MVIITNKKTGNKKRVLIDIGRNNNPKFTNSNKKKIEVGNVVNALKRKMKIEGLKRYNIDYMVITHNHDDHWSGLKNLDKMIHIKHLYYSKVYYGEKDFYKKHIKPLKDKKIIKASTAIGTVVDGETIKRIDNANSDNDSFKKIGLDFIVFPALTDKKGKKGTKDGYYVIYKASHHGTGAYRTDYANKSVAGETNDVTTGKINDVTKDTEYRFIRDIIVPNDIIVSGFLYRGNKKILMDMMV